MTVIIIIIHSSLKVFCDNWMMTHEDHDDQLVFSVYNYNLIINFLRPPSARIRASVDALSRDGTDMRGDAQNPKSFQAPRM